MNQATIIEAIRKHTVLSDEDAARFFSYFEYIKLPKNKVLISQGDLNPPFVLIRSGCLMTSFVDEHDHHHVIQFGREMWWTGDLNSITNNTPSSYTVKTMAESGLYILTPEHYRAILTDIPALERYFRSIFQNSLVSHQKRIIRNISFTAEQKYLAFRKTHPGLESLVPQKYIASFLGITPEFLSKLRKRVHSRSTSG